jgi:uncharacterized protein YxeA
MKQTIFGIILGILLVLTVYVGFKMYEKYAFMNSENYIKSTSSYSDIDGIRYNLYK